MNLDQESRNTFIYIVGILVVIGLIAFGISQLSTSGIFLWGGGGDKTYSEAPDKVIEDDKDYEAVIVTSLGEIRVELFADNAPTTVNNFVFLARDEYYDGVLFHRVVRDFIAQTGSRLSMDNNPQNDGLGGPGYRITDEVNWESLDLSAEQIEQLEIAGFTSDPEVTSIPLDKYYLAMANAGPNTNGSQFFVTLADAEDPGIDALQGRHTVFGRVLEGQSVLDEINQAEVDDEFSSSPRPIEPIVIESITIFEVER